MTVEHISEGLGSQQVQKGYLDAKKKVESNPRESVPASDIKRPDQVDISDDAKKLVQVQALVRRAREHLKSVDEYRGEKVDDAVFKIQIGAYDRDHVHEKVADALLAPGIKPDSSTEPAPAGEEAVLRLDRIREVEKKILEGFYETREVIQSVVEHLLNL